ncbi:hypothetical protein BU17DRAFT_45099 [Hysterangium stoloniferum]|nr:hypothetical protein BU17DRAFT_45099 [Hysterangium stoloniferum]
MFVLAIGASRHIGYLTSRRLLAEGHTVTFLLRNPSVFDEDPTIQKFVNDGHAKLIKGDATVKSDIQKAFDEARSNGQLDAVIFSVGGTPSFSAFSITKGFVLTPPNLCSFSLYNVLACFPEDIPTVPQPKLIVISSNGLTKTSHNALPLVLKPIFSYALHSPHADKLVMERALFHAANWTWSEKDPNDLTDFLGSDWQENLGGPGYLKEVVVVRPTLLTDGDAKPAKGVYKTSIEEFRHNAYSIPRKEVAHFIVEGLLKNWAEWRGNVVRITG